MQRDRGSCFPVATYQYYAPRICASNFAPWYRSAGGTDIVLRYLRAHDITTIFDLTAEL